MDLSLTSPVFDAGGSMPILYTCDGKDISPPLSWAGVPKATESLALIVDDPDAPDPAAPQRTWVHWVLYNIPAGSAGLPEKAQASDLSADTQEGINDWQKIGYGGPCPPIGRHRYIHKLYALDVMLPDLGHPNKAQLEQAMQGHIIEQTELISYYQRK